MSAFISPLFLDLLGIYILMGVSWYIPASCGQFSFGHCGLIGLAAYFSGALTTIYGLPLVIGLIAGMAISCLAGIVFSAIGLKSKDMYAAIMTLALAQIALVVFKIVPVTGGVMGFLVDAQVTPLIVWTGVIICLIFTWRVENSRLGRTFKAIKASNMVSGTLGLNTTYYKIIAFAIGGAMAGLAGVFYAHCISWIEPHTFAIWLTVVSFTFALVGGWETMWGAVVGAIFLTFLLEALRFFSEWRELIYGILVISVLNFRPTGLITTKNVRDFRQFISKFSLLR
ncbi:MAG: branched-chain amino acid ABC transporter permease [bacterium]|nr:branched-chain amino acid ABC transporter permease [bacterium]